MFILLGMWLWLGFDAFGFSTTSSHPATSIVSKTVASELATAKPVSYSQDKLQSLRAQLQAQQLKNALQAEQIHQLLAINASKNDLSCDDEDDEYYPSERGIVWQREENDRIAAQYEDRLAAETLDLEHSETVHNKVNEILTTHNSSGATLNDVACAESLCRIELEYDDQDAQSLFVSHFAPMLMETYGESFFQLLEYDDGSSRGILFVSRDGFGLPESAI